jgi:hypothetical protein
MTVTGSKLPQTIVKKEKNMSGVKGNAKTGKGSAKTSKAGKGGAQKGLQAGVRKNASNFKTAGDIANPVPTSMSILSDQVVS